MKSSRHWKERWDPDAEFVFARRMRLGIEGQEIVFNGDPVPRDLISLHRLKIWWNAGFIRLADPDHKPDWSDKPQLTRLTATVWEVRQPGKAPVRFDDAAEARKHLDKLEKQRSRKVKA